ncbi:MAG: indolepyruvate ferredoxin oxidoreductase subunit alpha [Deltaproteobacteria bacterium]|nr:indolepyruvate ferredoxin oxidoreductase subunit alpha [Deltaproteobacteria bacterium]
MSEIVSGRPGEKLLLLGNEAIVRGALEAGLAFASSYPGTPSSEVPDTFFKIKDEAGFYFEYATNEKVAMETVAGAAVAGVRAMTTLKHVGLNVAADPLMTLAYVGVNAGLVVYNADDPSLFSSQNEQDNRYYAKLSGLPMIEPTNAQELKDLTVLAFDLSEELKLPVILRSTTRLAHTRGVVRLGARRPAKTESTFTKSPFDYVPVPAVARRLHQVLLDKQAQAAKMSNASPLNKIIGSGKWGIVTGGVSFNYVADAVADLGLAEKVSVLKIAWTNPLPEKKILRFLKDKEKVLVVEELEPFLEESLQAMAQRAGLMTPIEGKDKKLFSRLFEYDPALVRRVMARYFKVRYRGPRPVETSDLPALPGRPPNLCPGCPHRMTYYAVKKAAGEEAIYTTDIGCYTLGLLPPISMADFLVCMGSSVSSAAGFARTQQKKVVGFIGDSTFFHSGITGLVNAVHNNHDFTLVILDNGTTAMTGHQPHPGMDTEMAGLRDQTHIEIESIVKGLGVGHVAVVKPRNLKKTEKAIQAALDYKGVSVVISKEICPLYERRFVKPKAVTFTVDLEKCKNHRDCLTTFACPAFYVERKKVYIDQNLCIGCAVCAQVCPEKAIVPCRKGA